jgi:hypothetical protein
MAGLTANFFGHFEEAPKRPNHGSNNFYCKGSSRDYGLFFRGPHVEKQQQLVYLPT